MTSQPVGDNPVRSLVRSGVAIVGALAATVVGMVSAGLTFLALLTSDVVVWPSTSLPTPWHELIAGWLLYALLLAGLVRGLVIVRHHRPPLSAARRLMLGLPLLGATLATAVVLGLSIYGGVKPLCDGGTTVYDAADPQGIVVPASPDDPFCHRTW